MSLEKVVKLQYSKKKKVNNQVYLTDYFPHFLGLTSANAHLNNATWISEYNFPAVLSRCKFPKTSDAVHELATNRNKNRTEPNLPPLPPEFASFAGTICFWIFY